jgi:hypothetical protein
MKYFGNAFSLNMLTSPVNHVRIEEVPVAFARWFASKARSVVGHADTAAVISDTLGVDVACNRATVWLGNHDEMVVAQYSGPRLSEGATSLPKGATIRYLWVVVKDSPNGKGFLATRGEYARSCGKEAVRILREGNYR